MTDVLDVPNLNQRVHRISVEFYHQLGELGLVKKQTELIRGVIINKMSKSPLHALLADELAEQLIQQLSPDAGCFVRRDNPLSLKDSVPEPDVSVVLGMRRDFRHRHPTTAELVIEIAVTSLADDRSLAAIYAEAGVKEYWIVNAQQRQVEAYWQPVNGLYESSRVYADSEVIVCGTLLGISIALAELFDLPA